MRLIAGDSFGDQSLVVTLLNAFPNTLTIVGPAVLALLNLGEDLFARFLEQYKVECKRVVPLETMKRSLHICKCLGIPGRS